MSPARRWNWVARRTYELPKSRDDEAECKAAFREHVYSSGVPAEFRETVDAALSKV